MLRVVRGDSVEWLSTEGGQILFTLYITLKYLTHIQALWSVEEMVTKSFIVYLSSYTDYYKIEDWRGRREGVSPEFNIWVFKGDMFIY